MRPGRSERGQEVLSIRGVATGYGKVQILRGIDMSVSEGQIVALLGGNGTGKSTLLKAISGLLPVWDGAIEFEGEPIQNRRPNEIVKRGLTQVTQGKDMYPAMTVEENLKIGAYTRKDRAGVAADMDKVFDYFPVLGERRRQLAATPERGRGADARHRPGPHGEPEAHHARRAELRPRPAHRPRHLQHRQSDQPERRDHDPARGTERQDGLAPRRVRLRDPGRGRPHRRRVERPHHRRQRAPRLPRGTVTDAGAELAH